MIFLNAYAINIILEGPIFPFLYKLATKNSYRRATSSYSFQMETITLRYIRAANSTFIELRIFRGEDVLEIELIGLYL